MNVRGLNLYIFLEAEGIKDSSGHDRNTLQISQGLCLVSFQCACNLITSLHAVSEIVYVEFGVEIEPLLRVQSDCWVIEVLD